MDQLEEFEQSLAAMQQSNLEVTQALIKFWAKYPFFRFGQIIQTIFGDQDIYYLPNIVIIEEINRFLKEMEEK